MFWELLGLSDLLRYEAFGATEGSTHVKNDKSVIFVWLPGGLPHMETYDMKPDAPAEALVRELKGKGLDSFLWLSDEGEQVQPLK